MSIVSVNSHTNKSRWPSPHALTFNKGQSCRTFPEWITQAEIRNTSVHFDTKPSVWKSIGCKAISVLKKIKSVFHATPRGSAQSKARTGILEDHMAAPTKVIYEVNPIAKPPRTFTYAVFREEKITTVNDLSDRQKIASAACTKKETTAPPKTAPSFDDLRVFLKNNEEINWSW